MSEPALRHLRILVSLVLIVVLIGIGIGVASLLISLRQEAPRREAGNPSPLVATLVLRPETVTEHFMGYGSARPFRAARIAAEVPGRVIELVDGIRAGSSVSEGQSLVRLDTREYQHALDRANAMVAADQADLERLDIEAGKLNDLIETSQKEVRVAREEHLRVADLYERKLAAKKEYDFSNLAFQQARRVLQGYQMEFARIAPTRARLLASKQARQAEAELAGLNLERCEIKAPFSGTIQTLLVEIGEYVGPGSVLLSLIDPNRVEIGIQLPAATYADVRVGAACRVDSESTPGVEWDGCIARIAPDADEMTRTFAAYVEVDNTRQDRPLLPGTFVQAKVQGPIHENVLLVPRGAIRDGHVLVATCEGSNPGHDPTDSTDRQTNTIEGVARRRRVTVARLIEDRVILTGQIAPSDRLILSHLSQLSDGSRVRVRSEATAPNTQDADPIADTGTMQP